MQAKANLEPLEKLKAAYMHDVLGVDQHIIAAFFGINSGRVNEAIRDVRQAIGLTRKEPTTPRKRGRPLGSKNKS
jgi:hypothetical protein